MADKKATHANEKLAYEIRRHMYDTKNAETLLRARRACRHLYCRPCHLYRARIVVGLHMAGSQSIQSAVRSLPLAYVPLTAYRIRGRGGGRRGVSWT
jgi:hypothetical protein